MSAYHIGNFGKFTTDMRSDINGYVNTTVASALAGTWDFAGPAWTKQEQEVYFKDLVAANQQAIFRAEKAIEEWRNEG